LVFLQFSYNQLNIVRDKKNHINKLLLIILSAILFSGCATMHIPDYPDTHVNDYNNRQVKDDLHLSAQVLTGKNNITKYFGTDLSEQNILTIHILAENKNSTSSFVIDKDQISLKNKNQKDNLSRSKQVVDGESTGGEVATVVGFTSILVAPVLMPVLVFPGFKAISNAEVIEHNLKVKELQTRTISPGKAINGFVYFILPSGNSFVKDWQLLVEATNLLNKKAYVFDLELN